MANRTIFVLRDSVTGLYYCSAGIDLYTQAQDGTYSVNPNDPYKQFDRAVIHTTEKSIKDGQKTRVTSFRRDLKISDALAGNYGHMRVSRELARERQNLPFFGIEIVTLTISDGK